MWVGLGLVWPSVVHADRVTLDDGTTLVGQIAERGKQVHVWSGDRWRSAERSQVRRIEAFDSPLAELERLRRAVARDDVDGLFRLGRWASRHELQWQARWFYRAVLAIAPRHVGAARALGGDQIDPGERGRARIDRVRRRQRWGWYDSWSDPYGPAAYDRWYGYDRSRTRFNRGRPCPPQTRRRRRARLLDPLAPLTGHHAPRRRSRSRR